MIRSLRGTVTNLGGSRRLLAGAIALACIAGLPVAQGDRVGYAFFACSDANVLCVDDTAGATQEFSTIQAAANAARAGDTVLVHNGNYRGFVTQNGGTASAPITYAAAGTSVVINTPTSGGDGINVEGTDYTVITGFQVRSATRAGIRVAVSHGVTVSNNVSGPNGKWGIFTAYATKLQILDNKAFGSTGEHGIYVSNSTAANDDVVVRGNEAYNNNQNGIQFNGDCRSDGDGVISNALMEYNRIHDNGWKGFSIISVQDSVIRNNVVYSNGLRGGAGGIHLADEPDCGMASNRNLVVNNTVAETRVAGIRLTNGSTANVIFNNIAIGTTTIADESSGNSIDGPSNFRGTVSTARFVNSAGGDYHLASNSPAINQGIASYAGKTAPNTDADGAARPVGGAFDIGAYEYGATGGSRPPAPPTNVRVIR